MKTLVSMTLALLVVIPSVSLSDDTPKAVKPTDSKPTVYDEKADAKALIENALGAAKRENRRVLIQWGGNWCVWCVLLHEKCKTDKDLSKLLRYEYDVVYIDSKNQDLAEKYGADFKKHGVPFLTVLDADGKVLANQPTEPFETKVDGKNGHDAKKILEFLTTHQAAPLKADAVLEAALAEASKSERRVLLHFGAPWCGWCLRLDAWLARRDVNDTLRKDFVEVKIDMDRMPGAKEVLARFNAKGEGGIPWFVILDAKGKAIITSDSEKGNIGFPADEHEIAYFVKMLEASKRKLTEADIAQLRKSLAPAPKAPPGK
jgi:thioredoxin-related protein